MLRGAATEYHREVRKVNQQILEKAAAYCFCEQAWMT
jgi:hypothetical protein